MESIQAVMNGKGSQGDKTTVYLLAGVTIVAAIGAASYLSGNDLIGRARQAVSGCSKCGTPAAAAPKKSVPLSEEHKNIVKATIPILEGGGELLTKHFYGIMLNEFPEVASFFNKTHQSSGEQPRALANAVLGYAKNIDHLENIAGVATQIIQKHVALAVKPEHYTIVGQCLLRAMGEVLGPKVATKEVIDAWAAAYGQLADILIAAEESCYAATAAKVGGWRGCRPFMLSKKVKESDEVTSFYFTPADGKPIVSYQPGQYLGLVANIFGSEYRRNYSLSALSNGKTYCISVKHEPRGAVSHYLHEVMHVGATINILPPAGYLVATESSKPLILMAGGIGVTPLLPIMEHALATSSRQVTFVHCCRNKEVQAFAQRVAELAAKYPNRLTVHNWYSNNGCNHINPEKMRELNIVKQADCEAFFVGPTSFMRDANRCFVAMGVPAGQLYYEFFGPASSIDN
jgi:nitric oxide dioxygenase